MDDVLIIGGGIVGLSTAYQLIKMKPGLKITVLEKEEAVAQHQSKNNSGVIHSGIYYKPGSLRARNCREGHAMLIDFCKEQDIPYDLCGKIIVATSPEEEKTLLQIYEKGKKNGLEGLRIIDATEAREFEPHVFCTKAIYVPQAGIVNYEEVAKRYSTLFTSQGGNVSTSQTAIDIQVEKNQIVVKSQNKEHYCKHLITCAGLYSDKITRMTMPDITHQIIPFRGEYYELRKESEHLVNNLIYPVPDVNFPFLGVHFTRMIHGGIEAGPNAVLAYKREGYSNKEWDWNELSEILRFTGFQKLARKYWRTGLDEIRRSYSKKLFVAALQKLIPTLSENDVVPGRSGVRAMACKADGNLVDDFVIMQSEKIINVVNAPSPAATASLAIGKEIVSRAIKMIEQ